MDRGIPLLYPEDLDMEHLREEEALGEEMIRPDASGGGSFRPTQWEKSKREFWDYAGKATADIENGAFINIGCGVDRNFTELARPGITLVGLDIVPALLRHLKKAGGMDIGIAGAVHRLPFRDNSFDCVCCIDLIHHEWKREKEILAGFSRILKPGGILILEDINAWGLGQFYKSILLPRTVHGALRRLYHRVKDTAHPPAEYEFPTSVFETERILRELDFPEISAVALESFPNAGKILYGFYRLASRLDRVRRYHNFHYMISARKKQ